MKPIYLSIEGINSFTSAQEINFSDAADGNIFCVCGPTGSGKTTILDSIIIALYGKGDRVDAKDDYINLSCDKGTVVFRFELGGAEWEAKRILSRKAGGDKAYLTNVSESVMVADGVEKVNAEIQKLIGLSRGDFTQVVILEQGKFGKFLTAGKSDRNKTIAQLFSLDKFDGLYAKFGSVAEKFASLGRETAAKAEHLRDLSRKLIAEKKAELKTAESELGKTKKTLEKLNEEVTRIAVERRKFGEVKAAKEELEKLKSASEAENAVKKALEIKRGKLSESEKAAAEAKAARDKAKDILAKSETARGKAELIEKLKAERLELGAAYKENEAKLNGIAEMIAGEKEKKDRILCEIKSLFPDADISDTAALSVKFNARKTELNSAVATDEINIGNYEKECGKLKTLREEFIAADGKIPALKEKFEKSDKAEKDAEKAFESARAANAAFDVASALKDGDRCPVCGGVYHSGVCAGGAEEKEISALKNAFDTAKAERERNASDLKLLCENRDRLFKEVKDAEKSAAESLEKIKCTQNETEIATAFSRLKDESEKVCTVVELLENAVKSDKVCDNFFKTENDLKVEKGRITQDGKNRAEEIKRHEAELKKLVGDDFETAEKAAKETVATCDKIIADCENLREELSRETQEHGARVARIAADIANCEKTLASAGNTEFDEKAAQSTENAQAAAEKKREDLIGAVTELKKFVSESEKKIEEKEKLEKEIKYYEKRRETAESLAKLMRGNKFLEYIEEEYIREFTSRASEKLFELSGGKFTLCYMEDEKKSDFWVVDHLRGGEKRKVRTLSGGETFLASLSMAIAISEQIAHNKSYDFFFLDEGFGTLDENAIDTVAAALYKLADETMVGLVSHRSELVEKIPSRIRVLPATEGVGSRLYIEKV